MGNLPGVEAPPGVEACPGVVGSESEAWEGDVGVGAWGGGA